MHAGAGERAGIASSNYRIGSVTVFEFIGIAVVCFVGWKIIGGILDSATRGHRGRTVAHAISLGVPADFAYKMVENLDIMKMSLAHMAKLDPDFRMKDVYVQKAEAIAMAYQGYMWEQQKEGK